MANQPALCCCICLVRNESAPAVEGWDGAPICRRHLIECGGPDHLRPPPPRLTLIEAQASR
ncbi:hypothetical protein [Bradyrhizobium sp. USDA 4486]